MTERDFVPEMEIECTNDCFIKMPSDFTLNEANYFQAQLDNIRQTSSNIRTIFVNFERTTFMDSHGLLRLCEITKDFSNTELEMIFESVSPQVNMILSLAGLDRVFLTSDS